MTADVNITSNIKLLPLPKGFRDRNLTGLLYRAADLHDYASTCVAHATAARDAELVELRSTIEALRAEVGELRAARIAYANEFPVNLDGEPDVGNIHVNIRSLKVRAERLAEALRRIAALKERESDELRDAVGIANEALEQENDDA